MPVPESYPAKVTKADFTAVAVETNTKVSKTGGDVIESSDPAVKGLVVKANAGQTASIFEVRDRADDAVVFVNGISNMFYVWYGEEIIPASASDVGLKIIGNGSQTGNLQEWKNSAGTVLAYVAPSGGLSTSGGVDAAVSAFGANRYSGINNGVVRVETNTAAEIGLAVRGTAGQTAPLAEFQNSAGTVLATVGSGGRISTSNALQTGTTGFIDGQLGSFCTGPTSKGLVVRGAASQTANLAEFQNSAGTVLAQVNALGHIAMFEGANSFGLTGNTSGGAIGAQTSVGSLFVVVNGVSRRVAFY